MEHILTAGQGSSGVNDFPLCIVKVVLTSDLQRGKRDVGRMSTKPHVTHITHRVL